MDPLFFSFTGHCIRLWTILIDQGMDDKILQHDPDEMHVRG